ncbi:unnamed protein product, partial [marine sediment metagenome]
GKDDAYDAGYNDYLFYEFSKRPCPLLADQQCPPNRPAVHHESNKAKEKERISWQKKKKVIKKKSSKGKI